MSGSIGENTKEDERDSPPMHRPENLNIDGVRQTLGRRVHQWQMLTRKPTNLPAGLLRRAGSSSRKIKDKSGFGDRRFAQTDEGESLDGERHFVAEERQEPEDVLCSASEA